MSSHYKMLLAQYADTSPSVEMRMVLSWALVEINRLQLIEKRMQSTPSFREREVKKCLPQNL